MEEKKEDNSVINHIRQLTEKEVYLYGKSELTDQDAEDLQTVKSELDRYWDLLRQRRAFRDAGDDPDRAQMRSADTIEHYKK